MPELFPLAEEKLVLMMSVGVQAGASDEAGALMICGVGLFTLS
jgi:hypothetical protein